MVNTKFLVQNLLSLRNLLSLKTYKTIIDPPTEQDTPHLQSPWIGRTDKQNEQLREDL